MSRRPPPRPKKHATTEAILAVGHSALPPDVISSLVISVLEALLFERGQLPCVVKLLQRAESQEGPFDGATRVSSMRRERHKFLEEFKCLEEVLRKSIASVRVKRVVLMLGSTTVSAREVFEIDVSNIAKCSHGDAVISSERVCRNALISILTGNVEWSRNLKSARRILRAHVLLNISEEPPQDLNLRPVRAFRIPRAACHVQFIAQCPTVASANQLCGGESLSTAVDTYADEASVEPCAIGCLEPVRNAATAVSDHTLAISDETLEVGSLSMLVDKLEISASCQIVEAVSNSSEGGATASLSDVACSGADDQQVAWFQIPVVLKGFSGISRTL